MRNKQCVLDRDLKGSPIEPLVVKSTFLPEDVAAGQIARPSRRRRSIWLVVLIAIVIPLGVLLREDFGHHGSAARGPAGWNQRAAKIEIAILVLREGLESLLVLAAVTAGLKGASGAYRPAIAAGVGTGFAATLVTWRVAAHVLDDIGRYSSALALQAGTGLLAIISPSGGDELVPPQALLDRVDFASPTKKAEVASHGGKWRWRVGSGPRNGIVGIHFLLPGRP